VARRLDLHIVAVVDISQDSLDLVSEECGVGKEALFTNLDDAMKVAIPDCAVISTTADSHADLVISLASKGVKYILVEKPMAVSIEQCKKMISECKKFGTALAVNHQMRFMEQYISPKNLLSGKEFGGFTSMTVTGGNFGFSMNALHYFEAFRFLANEDPYEVTAWFSDEKVPNPRGDQFEDRAGSIRVTTKSGKRLYMEIGADQGHGIQVNYFARNGFIVIDELSGEMRSVIRKAEFRELPTTRYGMPADTFRSEIKAAEVIDSTASVLEALFNNFDSVSGDHGILAVKVLVAAYESANNLNKSVKIADIENVNQVYPWA
jgi:predicted dehydrogenase